MFSEKEKIWIVLNYLPTKGLFQLRRDFIKHFNVNNHRVVPNPDKFGRVVSSFKLLEVLEMAEQRIIIWIFQSLK